MSAFIQPSEGEPTRLELATGMKLRVDETLPKNEIHVYQDGKLIGRVLPIRIEDD